MIRELSAKPKPTNNKARVLFILSICIAFICITTSTLVTSYKGIVSLLGVAALMVGVLTYTKYVSPLWFYDITFDSDGTPVFVVRQQIGRRHTTLCRISITEIVSVNKESAEQRRAHKTPEGVIRYSYMPTLDPAESYRITTSSYHERAEILIESSEGFAELLRAYAAEAREARGISEE